MAALLLLGVAKLVSWAVALGSGTSGGTLAPLFTIGGALGGLLGTSRPPAFPTPGWTPACAALVGMAAMFAGAARCLLASVVFAFEITLQPLGLLPLLGGCAAAYLVSALLHARRHHDREARPARRARARGVPRGPPGPAAGARPRHPGGGGPRGAPDRGGGPGLAAGGGPGTTHQGFPVVDGEGRPLGLLMARRLVDPALDPPDPLRALLDRPVAVAFEGNSLREAADHMVREGVGRLRWWTGTGGWRGS